jgi:hypothetical protein
MAQGKKDRKAIMKRRDFLKLSAGAAALFPLAGFGGKQEAHASLNGISLYSTQQQFVDCNAPLKAMVGGRGAGTTYAGACNTLYWAKANGLYLVTGPTYSHMKDATWRTYYEIARKTGCLKMTCQAECHMIIRTRDGGEAQIDFRSDDRIEHVARGPNYSGWHADHASYCSEALFRVATNTMRKRGSLNWAANGQHKWAALTLTPACYWHWTQRVCEELERLPGRPVFRATTYTNPYLPDGFAGAVGDNFRKSGRAVYRSQIMGRFA